jgi:hypothetical protein
MLVSRILILFFCVLFSHPPGTAAIEIVSISPSTAAIGSQVSVTGGPFEDGLRVLIGDLEVRPSMVAERQLAFEVPALPAGDYLLSLKRGEQATARPFLLRIVDPQPVILNLEPARVDLCSSGDQRRILVHGRDFAAGARLLVDGAQLPAERISSSRIEFTLPDLTVGLHRVQVIHSDGNGSLPFAVLIDGVPEIISVVPGEDRVVSYDLVIHGRNFAASSDLLVNGVSVKFSLATTGKSGGGRDVLRFVDCQTLIYTRFPLDSDPEQLSLTVVVPGAERSTPFYITAP